MPLRQSRPQHREGEGHCSRTEGDVGHGSETKRFDPADYLTTDEAPAEYINAALETGDPAFIADSLGIVARAKGMAKVARRAGLGRESLYQALCAEGNPEFATVLKVVEALGLRLTAAAGRSNVARRRKRAA